MAWEKPGAHEGEDLRDRVVRGMPGGTIIEHVESLTQHGGDLGSALIDEDVPLARCDGIHLPVTDEGDLDRNSVRSQ